MVLENLNFEVLVFNSVKQSYFNNFNETVQTTYILTGKVSVYVVLRYVPYIAPPPSLYRWRWFFIKNMCE